MLLKRLKDNEIFPVMACRSIALPLRSYRFVSTKLSRSALDQLFSIVFWTKKSAFRGFLRNLYFVVHIQLVVVVLFPSLGDGISPTAGLFHLVLQKPDFLVEIGVNLLSLIEYVIFIFSL